MLKIQFDKTAFQQFVQKNKRLLKNSTIALALIGTTAGAGVAYAESNLYRQHKANAVISSKVSASQAIDLATQKVAGQAVSVDFDRDLGATQYEVDIITANGEKHEVGIDANTGAVKYDQRKTSKRTFAQPAISLQKAIEIATQHAQGTVKDAELEHDKGVLRYEIKTVQANGMKQEMVIDANTGAVLYSGYDD